MLKLLISDYEVALETDADQGSVVNEVEEEWEDDENVNNIDMFSSLRAGGGEGVCMCCACRLCCLPMHAEGGYLIWLTPSPPSSSHTCPSPSCIS